MCDVLCVDVLAFLHRCGAEFREDDAHLLQEELDVLPRTTEELMQQEVRGRWESVGLYDFITLLQFRKPV